MKNEYKFSIKEEGSDEYKKYFVKDETINNDKQKPIKIRWWCCVVKILPFVMMVALLYFTYKVFINNIYVVPGLAEKNKTIEKVYEYCNCEPFPCKNNGDCCKSYLKTEKTNECLKIGVYPIIIIIYFGILIGTIIALIVIYANDDLCIKIAKLDELHEIKNKLLKTDFHDSVDKIIESYDSKIKNSDKDNSNKNTIVSEKHNDADLLKHYMTCITEL